VKSTEQPRENTKRAIPQVTSQRDLVVRETPWRVYRTPWTLPVRNKTGRSSEEEPVERVRNPAGGTYPVWQAGVEWIRSSQASKGRKTP
jgi:hypothetical protein